MRALAAIFCLASAPALAWDVTLGPVCVLISETEAATIELTYDPAQPLYTLSITLAAGQWPAAPAFQMGFEGPYPLTIGTDRHVLSDDGQTLSVADQGFGNVLNGLQFNLIARAVSGSASLDFSLENAPPAVQAFRECPPFTGA